MEITRKHILLIMKIYTWRNAIYPI